MDEGLSPEDLARRRAGRDDLNAGYYLAERESLHRLIAGYIDRVIELEKLIARIGEALRISQPPMYGKYDVRWWKINGMVRPVLVKWVKAQRADRYKVVPVRRFDPRDMRTDRGFALNAGETLGLIRGYLEAEREWKKAQRVLSSLRRLATQERGLRMEISNGLETVDGLQARVVENLRRAGYAVESKYDID